MLWKGLILLHNTVGLDKTEVLEELPIEIKVSTILNFAEPVNLEYKERSELERRVSEVLVRSPPRWHG